MRLWLKLLLSYLVIICATVMISVAGIHSAEDVRDSFHQVNREVIPHLLALKDLRHAGLRIVSSSMEYAVITAMDSAVEEGSDDSHQEEEKQDEIKLIAEGRANFRASVATCRTMLFQETRKKEQSWPVELMGMKLLSASDEYLRLVDAKASPGRLIEAKESFEASEMGFLAAVTAAHDTEMRKLERYVDSSFKRVSRAIVSAIVLCVAAVTGSLILGLTISLSISRRIHLLKSAAHEVAAGNRDVVLPVVSNDEITSVSVSFNRMVETLRDFEGKLDSTNRYLDSIIDTMPEALTVVSVNGAILDVNRATEDVMGFERNWLVGRQFTELFSDREQGHEFVRAVTAGEALVEQEAVLVTREGEEVNVSLSAKLLDYNDSGGRFICLSHDITRRKLAEREVHNLAYFDQLTGLANRTLFFDRCSQALARAERHRELFAILFIDLDHFKDINDTMGHHAGDRLLQLVVERFQSIVRATDTLARLGGDEFALLCSSLPTPDGAAKVADKLLALLKEPFDIDNRQIYTAASIGMVIFPDDGNDIGALLKNADLAMYAAKSAGGNCHEFFSQELNLKAQERADIEEALRKALQRNELTLHYQPQIHLDSGRVIGMEALARWTDTALGVIPPDRFIPVAEQTGLIKELGEWVLKEACAQCKEWHQGGYGITVGVNVSILQLMHNNFAETVVSTLLEVGLDPKYLDLELTESMLMENAGQSVNMLKCLKSLGVKISIDDFGTGYSSLSYLKNFAIDRIKIDQSFIRDITSRADAAGIVNAIVAIGHSMGVSVIAEGVESLQEEEKLVLCRCDEAQGYYYARPMPAAEAARYLVERNGAAG